MLFIRPRSPILAPVSLSKVMVPLRSLILAFYHLSRLAPQLLARLHLAQCCSHWHPREVFSQECTVECEVHNPMVTGNSLLLMASFLVILARWQSNASTYVAPRTSGTR